MATKQAYKTTFEPRNVIRPVYTGGTVGLDNGTRVLAGCLDDDVVLTDPATGTRLARIEGVSLVVCLMGDCSDGCRMGKLLLLSHVIIPRWFDPQCGTDCRSNAVWLTSHYLFEVSRHEDFFTPVS